MHHLSVTSSLQGLHNEGEYPLEVGRTLGALASLGLYQRAFEKERAEWERLVMQYPSIGYFPADRFDPDSYRTNRKLPTHIRMTDRDAYWGAKLVTSFSDAQIAAVVATSGIPSPDVEYLEHALRVRRDILGRRYLRAIAAVENPATTADGLAACFDDLAMVRGYLRPPDVRYLFEITDGTGRRLATEMRLAARTRTCVPIPQRVGDGTDDGYRIIEIVAQLAGGSGANRDALTKASRIHLRWREGEQRFVVVGLDRDE